jgi:hypothetical protein
MPLRRVVPFFAFVLAAGIFCPLLRAQLQDVAEAARKAKEKKQQNQTETDKSPAKPKKTYTNEDIPESKSSASAKPDSAPTKEDSATVTLSLPKSTSARPGGTNVLWSVHNTSDHFMNLTITLIVTGPCGFHSEHPLRFSLNPGGHFGIGNGAFGTAFYQDSCPGVYTFELRAMSYGKLLDSTTATITVL